jgi:hypothetical protein
MNNGGGWDQVLSQTIETTVPIKDVEDIARLELPISSNGTGSSSYQQRLQ